MYFVIFCEASGYVCRWEFFRYQVIPTNRFHSDTGMPHTSSFSFFPVAKPLKLDHATLTAILTRTLMIQSKRRWQNGWAPTHRDDLVLIPPAQGFLLVVLRDLYYSIAFLRVSPYIFTSFSFPANGQSTDTFKQIYRSIGRILTLPQLLHLLQNFCVGLRRQTRHLMASVGWCFYEGIFELIWNGRNSTAWSFWREASRLASCRTFAIKLVPYVV